MSCLPYCVPPVRVVLVCVLAAVGVTVVADEFPEVYDSPSERDLRPMSASEAAAGMSVPEGFSVSVFASEPDVQNPIAMAWDDNGRLWIAENYTYADRTQRFDLSLRDRVLIFEDKDNDGRADSRKVFTDQVQMLTSVEVGRGGVWLMCPPQLLFIPDPGGEGIPAGPAQVMLDGFDVAEDNYHNFANGLRWGPDGWLYGRCGHSCPGRIGPPGTPEEARIPLDGGVWRYHPDQKIVEVLCHGTVNPWGHDWDEHGELFFINTVIGHVWHVMPGAHFKESFGESMNPAVYERMDTIADHYHFDTNEKWAASRYGQANDFGGGHAHIGMMVYQADRWPEQYRGRLFTLNMHGQRANVERLERFGAGYTARHEPDFLIATDPFFRGIDIRTGPDGNVFVIDWSDTGECHEHTGVHRNSGRIFKISHDRVLTSPDRRPAAETNDSTQVRLSRLWKQYRSGETTPEMLRDLLRDPDEHLRVWAIRLLTDFWPLDTIVGPRKDAVCPNDPTTRNELVRMAHEDESSLVQLVLASTLQRFPVEHRAQLAAGLLKHSQHANDRDLPALVWYGLIPIAEDDPMAVVQLAKQCRWPSTVRWISRNLASRIEHNPQPLDALLAPGASLPPEWRTSVLLGMSDAFRGWRTAPQPAAWEDFTRSFNDGSQADGLIRELSTLFGDGRALDELRSIALDSSADMKTRQSALQTLIQARPDDLRDLCESLLNVRILNATAVTGLALFDDPEIGRQLARSYRRFHPDDRPRLLETLVSRPHFAMAMLEAIDAGSQQAAIRPSDLSAFHARQIHSLGDEALNRKLADVWGELRETSAERRELINELKQQLADVSASRADLSAGRALFEKTCAACHRLYGEGKAVGPDLTGSQRTNLDYLLENIIDPSAVVGSDYRMTVVVTADGRVLNGLVVSKNDAMLVLQTATEQQTIRIEDIDELRETSLSPMPDGLLKNLSPDQIRDLIAYLRHPSQVELP